MTSVWTSERFEPGCAVGAPAAALQIAREGHADPKPFMVALAICISTSFCTPVAHETTMLVMGPGRYRFKHYLSIGSGMAVIAWLLTTFVTPLVWRF
jgi:di/tricarboxylate transporter